MESMKAINIHNLSYRYPNGKNALANIALSIDEGEKVGLIGPNGAGKSTLLWHLNGLLPEKSAKSPSVYVMGIPLLESNFPQIRAMIGMLFQDSDDQLFMPTVHEDIAFGPMQLGKNGVEISAIEKRVLSLVGLPDFERRHTNQLSQGEKRRICLACVIACDAKVLALDEPTSGLDPRGRRELKTLLLSMTQTMLIASHDLEFIVDVCSRVVVIDKGRLVADGLSHDLMNNENLMLEHGLERPHILRHWHPH
jgi:energy-coupling factor transporter ATP-binding protein EcfA2